MRRTGIAALAACALALLGGVIPASPAAAACAPGVGGPLTEVPWPIRSLQPQRAWPLTKGEGVVVAVVDSGVSGTHPQLSGALLPGKDYVDGEGDGTEDCYGHGTIVAGIIAGRPIAGRAFHGVAPAAKILPLRVIADGRQDTTGGYDPDVARAIDYAIDAGAKVINLSLTTQDTPVVERAIARAVARDVVVVAAAGNEGRGTNQDATRPASYAGVIAVAGVDENGVHVATSSAGAYIDIAAPGADIDGPAPRGGEYLHTDGGGTSYAAPFIAGTAALVRAYHPELTAAQVTQRILDTADPPPNGRNDLVGHGLVNPYRAVAALTAGVEPARAAEPALVPPVRPERDPFGGLRTVAGAAAGGGVVLTVLILVAGATLPRGRRRGWRPGRRLPERPPAPPGTAPTSRVRAPRPGSAPTGSAPTR